MNDRRRRLILLLVGLTLTVLLQQRGRAVSPTGDVAAFLPSGVQSRGEIVIRIQGDVIRPGIYMVSSGVDPRTVINMTIHASGYNIKDSGILPKSIRSGDVLSLVAKDSQLTEIKMEKMNVLEKMLLGVPLDPNRMDVSEWEYIPGIGPATAKKIVYDRQNYGDFSSIRDLLRVPGIGEGKLRHMERYFGRDVIR